MTERKAANPGRRRRTQYPEESGHGLGGGGISGR